MAAKKSKKGAKNKASAKPAKAKATATVATTSNGAAAAVAPTTVAASDAVPMRVGVERARYKEKLPVEATQEERVAAGQTMADLVNKIEEFKIRKREELAALKEERSGLDARLNEAAGVFNGKKLEETEVVEMLYPETCSVDVIRLDTSEVVRTRAATAEDLQEQMRVDEETAVADKAIALITGGRRKDPDVADPNDVTDPTAVLQGKLTEGPPRPIENIVRDNEKAAEDGGEGDDGDAEDDDDGDFLGGG